MNTIDLGGEWQLRWSDGQRGRRQLSLRDDADTSVCLAAQVPGEVHLDLMRAGLIAEPNLELNVLAARWVEESFWTYRRDFEVGAEQLGGRSWLYFGQLYLAATIYLNGAEIGTHKNAFRPCRLDVSGKLKAGTNTVVVNLESGLFDVSDRQGAGFNNSDDQMLHKRHWLRAPQSQFSWDWSPRLLNVGITGDVRLEHTTTPARIEAMVPLATLSDDHKAGSVRTRMIVEGLGAEDVAGTLAVTIEGQTVTADVTVKPGECAVEATITIANPRLWWPVGHGAPNRYEITAALTIGGAVIGERSAMIGFRQVVVDQSVHPERGRYFVVEVNGKRIFAKGGNFVPADIIPARLDRKRYEGLVDLALEANFNLLRVWGGGLYESDDFYDLCDEKGVLVWQEFIFACGRYPVQDVEFFNNVKAEAVYNIRRLARYPSLIVWCGNNEMEWGSWEWGYDSRGEVMPDHALFHLTIPRLLAQEDPTRYYQASSPYSPDVEPPNADHLGDQHPWTVGIMGHDFREYRQMTCRFPNEGGTLGSTSLPTMLACLPKDQRRYNSFAWQIHDNSIAGAEDPGVMERMFDLFLGRHPSSMDIDEFTYWAGLLQGEALREYIDNFRRREFDSASAIFWMYNDVWPAVRSWTIVDYYLRRTPSFCPVRRAFAPLSIVVADCGDTVGIYGVNETSEPVNGELRFGVFTLSGEYPIDHAGAVILAAGESTLLATIAKAEWAAFDANFTASAAFAMLSSNGKMIARNRLFLPPFKELVWPKVQVSATNDDGDAVFASAAFAWGVCVDLDGESPLADNFFDIYPGVPYRLPGAWHSALTVLRVGNLTRTYPASYLGTPPATGRG